MAFKFRFCGPDTGLNYSWRVRRQKEACGPQKKVLRRPSKLKLVWINPKPPVPTRAP
jgi:hypothetical protein